MERFETIEKIPTWALCVARSDLMGSAKASKSGMSDEYRLPRFFYVLLQMLYHKLWRVGLYI